ncbi:hypothetical protein GCM10010992_04400 [Cloacibacterium rupense]|uniref:Pectinesterase catalytic domain-containing protein n=1 Tax=Cloacibacterium rupense TaxID=517423 RepID=A0ABQ2NGK0_9FLAO|nr:pectinesterase family protein [Cloacibacterium rupense]GGP01954.1 hypothetical protein GCM10010992_04400 [Cloacibacterium rupense]
MKKIILLFSFLMFSLSNAQLIDVWDFGAVQLDNSTYNNMLDENAINAWYSGVTPGTSGKTLPNFTSGILSWVGNPTSDRLRTSNTNLTRYDTNTASVTAYTGRVYANGTITFSGGLPSTRYIKMNLNEDDELTVIARCDTGTGTLTFVNESNPSAQSDVVNTTSTAGAVTTAVFVAKTSGTYRIADSSQKESFFRIYRKQATYTSVSGNIDTSNAVGIPSSYSLVFTNTAGKTWTVPINSNNYSASLPIGYTYSLSLVGANGYIITSGASVNTTGASSTLSNNIAITKVTLENLSGNITGLGTSISNLGLTFTPAPASGSVYVPTPIINTANSTYSVNLDQNIPYTITTTGVNDYQISPSSVNISANTISDLSFTAKPVFPITINASGLTTAQQASLQLKFTNINEAGYVYTFSDINNISLRNGTYKIEALGLDNYPVELALTSNLVVNNGAASKTITFQPVTKWSFDDKGFSSNTTVYYKGMQLNGTVSGRQSQGDLTANSGATILVPITAGQKVLVYFYYAANFSIDGGNTISTTSGSTSNIENTQYIYNGSTDGFVTISVGGTGTSYFTEIKVVPNVTYTPTITVGNNKQYQTINAALDAITNMVRPNNERVTIEIDPGNYEEMLVITQPNITLKNASSSPNTNVLNKGVNIDPNAVRITSYYGHGYNYYSMANNQKWNQNTLNVNLQNGNYSYSNTGAGTTNGSYWNATVVVNANGFQAENIIFENSFNQYISLKESQDVVVPWSSGTPGARPTTFGDVAVQQRSYVERAAAIAFANNTDKAILNNCKVIGRQDTFFGGVGARVVVYKGEILGAVDYIFGGMTAVFYKTKLIMNVTDATNDLAYITAAQQSSGRGYLMYACTITSTTAGVDTNSNYRANPGYFGRPWQANTSEVVFYNTTIETSNNPNSARTTATKSLIVPIGWNNSLGGTSSGMYEYGTTEQSGVDNSSNRATWATYLTNPILNDGTPITAFNFTKGNDNWDPISILDNNGTLNTNNTIEKPSTKIYSIGNDLLISNIKNNTKINIYNISGSLQKTLNVNKETKLTLPKGIWIVTAQSIEGLSSTKVLIK